MKKIKKKQQKPKVEIKRKKYKPKKSDKIELLFNDISYKNSFKSIKNNIEEINENNCKNRLYNSVDKITKRISILTLTDNIISSYKINQIKESNNKEKILN